MRTRPATPDRHDGTLDPPADARARILTAALTEFARHGFAGARVDRIARAAHVNKAMLYYHVGGKAKLYRAAIQRMLGTLVERLETVAHGDGTAETKLDRFIETFVAMGLTEPAVAPIMLREVVEGGTHLDKDTFLLLARIVGTMTTIVGQGQQSGEFRQVDPLLTYLTTAWPIMIYLASGPLRASVSRHTGLDTGALDSAHFIRHMQEMSRQALAVPADGAASAAATHRHMEHAS